MKSQRITSCYKELLISVILFFPLLIICLSHFGYDLELHCFNVAQFLNGHDTIVANFYEKVPLKYHYGYDLMLSYLIKITHLPYPYAATIILILCSSFCMLSLSYYLHYVSKDLWAYGLTIATFFFAFDWCGIYLKKFYDLGILYQIGFWSDINQSSWVFTLPLLIILVILFHTSNLSNKKQQLYLCFVIFVLAIFAPIYAATSMMLLGLSLFTLFLFNVINKNYKFSMIPIFTGIGLLILWKIMNKGLFLSLDVYEMPSVSSIFIEFNIKRVFWTFLYYITIQPVAFIVFLGTLYELIFKFNTILNYKDERLLLIILILVCYPLPFIIYFNNLTIFDNFCKFNLLGMYASYIFIVHFFNAFKMNNNTKIIFCLFVVFAFRASMGQFLMEIRIHDLFRDHRKFEDRMVATPKLNVFLRRNKIKDPSFLVLSKKHSQDYHWDPIHRDFVFCFNIAEEFPTISYRYGLRTINFYDLNHEFRQDIENRFIFDMNEVMHNNPKGLIHLHPTYLIMQMNDIPFLVYKLRRLNRIRQVDYSIKENWVIYNYFVPN